MRTTILMNLIAAYRQEAVPDRWPDYVIGAIWPDYVIGAIWHAGTKTYSFHS